MSDEKPKGRMTYRGLVFNERVGHLSNTDRADSPDLVRSDAERETREIARDDVIPPSPDAARNN